VDQICLVVPVQPGKTDVARDFMRELEESRKDEYDRSEQRIGITKEVWFLAPGPSGDQLVAYMESGNFQSAFEQFVASQDGFDLWFKQRFADATGIDLNNPPEMALPELLSSYEAGVRVG
jgi:Family of unknown function (DUF6176)